MGVVCPVGLSARSRALWKRLTEEWELQSHSLETLRVALSALDRMDEAAKDIKRHGMLIKAPTGQTRPNPCLAVERDSRAGFLGAWKLLGFDIEPPREVGRPPSGGGK